MSPAWCSMALMAAMNARTTTPMAMDWPARGNVFSTTKLVAFREWHETRSRLHVSFPGKSPSSLDWISCLYRRSHVTRLLKSQAEPNHALHDPQAGLECVRVQGTCDKRGSDETEVPADETDLQALARSGLRTVDFLYSVVGRPLWI